MAEVDEVNLALLRGLMAGGALVRHVVGHSWPGCDGQQTCVCPDPNYSYRVTPAYRERLEALR